MAKPSLHPGDIALSGFMSSRRISAAFTEQNILPGLRHMNMYGPDSVNVYSEKSAHITPDLP